MEGKVKGGGKEGNSKQMNGKAEGELMLDSE